MHNAAHEMKINSEQYQLAANRLSMQFYDGINSVCPLNVLKGSSTS